MGCKCQSFLHLRYQRDGERENKEKEQITYETNKKANSERKELNTILAVIVGNANIVNIVRLNRNQTQS